MKKPRDSIRQDADSRDEGGVSRREFFSTWAPPLATGLLLGGAGVALSDRPGRHDRPDVTALEGLRDWRTDPSQTSRMVLASGNGPRRNLATALAALGGIESFVKQGERVVIKPNCAWDRTPEQAANTNPHLIGELARLCVAAGAASVLLLLWLEKRFRHRLTDEARVNERLQRFLRVDVPCWQQPAASAA